MRERARLAAAAAVLFVAACAAPTSGPLPERLPAPGSTGMIQPKASPSAAVTSDPVGGALPPAATAAPAAAQAAPAASGSSVSRALSASDRPADHRARDAERQSAAVLAFSGIETGDAVLDMGAFTGYSTWLLSGLVGPSGSVIAQNPQEWFTNSEEIGAEMNALRAARPNVIHQVMPFDQLDLDPGSFDAVFSAQIYHDTAYMDVDRIYMNQQIYNVLKPGGVYVVIDHHAAPGAGARDAQALHRIEADVVRREVESVGFRLEATSDVLTRPGDDLTRNVFDQAVRGRTSQFVYKFVKPM